MQETRPENKELELDEEHLRLLEEARKQPGMKEIENLYRSSLRRGQAPTSHFLPVKATRTVTSTGISRPDPWART